MAEGSTFVVVKPGNDGKAFELSISKLPTE
jgi:hypothetical protein